VQFRLHSVYFTLRIRFTYVRDKWHYNKWFYLLTYFDDNRDKPVSKGSAGFVCRFCDANLENAMYDRMACVIYLYRSTNGQLDQRYNTLSHHIFKTAKWQLISLLQWAIDPTHVSGKYVVPVR